MRVLEYYLDGEGVHARTRSAARLLIDCAASLWHLGDGEGSSMFEALYLEAKARGLPWPAYADNFPAAWNDQDRRAAQEAKTTRRKRKISRDLARRVMERDLYRCVDCGTHEKLTCDHVIPESKGGPTTYENLRTRCMPCNHRKGVKMPEEVRL